MRLTQATDFTLRLLILLAQRNRSASIQELARALRIPRSHLMKIVARLSVLGYVDTKPGRGGGVRLGRPAIDIRIGEVVRAVEGDFGVVECLSGRPSSCVFLRQCALRPAMHAATEAFIQSLDGHTLRELTDATQRSAASAT